MVTRTLAAILLAGAILAGRIPEPATAAETLSQKAEADKTVSVANGDPAMAAAFDRARATLPTFFDTLAHPAPTMEAFAVKVGLPAPRGTEYVWLSSPSLRDGQIHGTINNQLEYATGYHEGQRIQLPEKFIVDWMYVDAGRMKGNFTACALASKLSRQERREFEQQYQIDCGTKP